MKRTRALAGFVLLIGFIWLLTAFYPFALEAQVGLKSLENDLIQAKILLKRIEDGKSPCLEKMCQQQKSHLLNQIFQISETIPWSFETKIEAFQAARHFVAQAYKNPRMDFPKSFDEWKFWWERRYSYEGIHRFQWMAFVDQIESFYFALDIFLRRAQSASAEEKELLQESWNRKAGLISFLMRRHALLMDQAMKESMMDRTAEALKDEALRIYSERESVERDFGGSFAGVLEELFPQIDFIQAASCLGHVYLLTESYQETQIFKSDFLSKVLYWRNQLKKLSQLVQEFNDLEYGSVGLKNFNSSTNPAVLAEFEIVIQEFLDQFDSVSRQVVSIASFYLMTKLVALGTNSLFLKASLPSGFQIFEIQKGFELSEFMWSPSHRSHELSNALAFLQERFQRRLSELFRARKILIEKIKTLEAKYSELKQQGELQ